MFIFGTLKHLGAIRKMICGILSQYLHASTRVIASSKRFKTKTKIKVINYTKTK